MTGKEGTGPLGVESAAGGEQGECDDIPNFWNIRFGALRPRDHRALIRDGAGKQRVQTIRCRQSLLDAMGPPIEVMRMRGSVSSRNERPRRGSIYIGGES